METTSTTSLRDVLMSLGQDRSFQRLWMSASVSLFSSEVGTLALPTAAVIMLHADAVQLGILRSLETTVFPLLGLAAGVWVDRFHPRRVMIMSDVVRCLTLL